MEKRFQTGSLGNWRHLCVDMQKMFAEDTPWHVPWMERVSPEVVEVAGRHSQQTIFTRFIPPVNAAGMPGTWGAYYTKWWMMTGEHLPAGMVELIEPLAALVPPAEIHDKRTYSPWVDGTLHLRLQRNRVSTLVISGGETDVCVLAATLGAIDLGYQVILLKDAVCSSADDTHDASLELLGERFSVQLQLMTTETFLAEAS
ncbi:cysteine hydrolase family protein [Sinorhizobium terangae]|uniref:Isochorismatase family protein n=1 Tax=Sinorhizobium terangae TaxID=110322 RepID=A0A6N7LF16_SINTE|nr:cysteine hydrolase [Sinorhizobium terangae]MBB4184598.1 nicotinamidase-related amidase [Sinorhizobium terangae]MQX16471.1 isochorismatase family protein [Sinorhizobium terangae]WFU50547.1 cysteine hydrolase [Sinorhizobium terangae]